jgi:hypothetical protein
MEGIMAQRRIGQEGFRFGARAERPGNVSGACGEAAARKHTKRILTRTGTGNQTVPPVLRDHLTRFAVRRPNFQSYKNRLRLASLNQGCAG